MIFGFTFFSVFLTLSLLSTTLICIVGYILYPKKRYCPKKLYSSFVPEELVCEHHDMQTEDGYIITIQRVYHPQKMDK